MPSWWQNRQNRQNTGYFAGIPGKPRVYLENTLRPPGYRADFLNFASDFAPDQLSDSGKLASFQNGAPNTLCFPWKFPETQSAGDPLFSFLFAGKACAGQLLLRRPPPRPVREIIKYRPLIMRDHVTCEGCVWLVLRAFPWLSVLRREEALDHSWYDYRLTKGSIDEVGSGKRHTTVTVETQLICQIKTPLQPSLPGT